MKDQRDPGTAELALQPKRGRGRPRKADALTPAERARRYRERKRAGGAAHHPAQAATVTMYRLRAALAAERREIEQMHAEIVARDRAIAQLRAELTAAKNRDVTETADDAHAPLRALASVADRMRAFASDPGAIVKPRTLQVWARTLDVAAGRDVTKKSRA